MNEIDIAIDKYKAALGDLELLKGILECGYDEDIIMGCINKAVSSSEVAFLSAKNIMKYYPKEKLHLGFNRNGNWKCEKSKNGIHFVLPPMVSKHNKNKAAADGKAIRNLVFEMIEKEHFNMPFAFCEITFCFHIGQNGKDPVPDFDNLDIKSFIDSLQGSILKNDTVLDYELHAYGVEDKNSFTEVWIFEAEKGVEKGIS